ncbi:penicillin acylase family protein [Streptacidiphilus fuscans]|uniref:Penicillin acylase family protein n=1 Tax=Streptacidiphilus fuscans TaxID=2789292 RepID=A0A931B811_9ACTN|nr:penicillin acylase family protein [Streptacidiphilus fuscans]MBF9071603.1 penicillin acylase family protein [Streptacidiphilus fuscans]MBF9072910.1 penicillin acylase family protein [Streptacidiphilus fuscans]
MPRSSRPKRPKKSRRLRLMVVLVVLLLVGGVAFGSWYGVRQVRASLPQTTGTIHLQGVTGPVQVIRDSSGIPQIYASSPEDLFMAQGYVQAQDRFWQMDVDRHITGGTLSSMFGAGQLQTDAFIRTMDWQGVAQKEWDTQLSQSTKDYLTAYTDGVNAWLKQHPGGAGASLEYALLGVAHSGYKPAPWTPVDSVSWLTAMAWDLSGNMQQEIDRSLLSGTFTSQEISQLYPSYPYTTNGTILKTGEVKDGTYTPAEGARTAPVTSDSGSSSSSSSNGSNSSGTSSKPGGATNASYQTAGGSTAAQGAQTAAEALGNNLSALPTMLGRPGAAGIGSNSWVVDGAHTTTGKPLLANDPHLSPQMPSIWYQMGLHCTTVDAQCPFDVTGFTFPGMPGVIIGHNQTVSWGFTNVGSDVQDLYLEQVNSDGTYLYDGKNIPLVTHQVTIPVAGSSPQTITVRSTQDGMPIISDHSTQEQAAGSSAPVDGAAPPRGGGYAIALKWTALTPNKTMDAVFELDKAQNFGEFRGAAKDFSVPAQNLIYADTKGNIGYQMPGQVPIRPKISGDDGTYPQPGWDSRYKWTGQYVPFDALPWVENPPEGYIVTANQAAVDPNYPYLITNDWDYGTRAKQIDTLIQGKLNGGGKISPDDMASIQEDDTSVFAKSLVPYLLNVKLNGSYYTQAQDLLRGWNFQQDAGSAAAAYYNAVWSNLLHLAFDQKFPAAVRSTTDCIMVVPASQQGLPADDVNGQPQRVRTCGLRDDATAQPDGNDQWTTVVGALLDQPNSEWWNWTDATGKQYSGRDNLLAQAMVDARKQLTSLMGKDISTWSWGRIHTLELQERTLGTDNSNIASGAVHWLLNRGPYELSGGSAAVDASSWDAANGFTVDEAPSMRMIVDLSDFDASRWINIGGASGHAFSANYDDQMQLWANGQMLTWAYSKQQVQTAGKATLTLAP